jgi:hypothetical protein
MLGTIVSVAGLIQHVAVTVLLLTAVSATMLLLAS